MSSRAARLLHPGAICFVCLLFTLRGFAADQLLVESESFEQPGGWVLDTQFIEIMGSPYLLAHGLGVPVADATTTVTFPSAGTYRVLVRTKDWVARWKAPGAPGKFQLLVGGKALAETFGTRGAEWSWHGGGAVEIAQHGAARRETLDGPIRLPDGFTAPPAVPATKTTGAPGLDPAKLPGLVLDDSQAKLTGKWSGAANLQGYVGTGYRYRAANDDGAARYEFTIPKTGSYEVRLSYGAHENRATNAPVSIEGIDGKETVTVNQRVAPPLPQGFISLGVFHFQSGKPAIVTIGGATADGNVHADAVQLLHIVYMP